MPLQLLKARIIAFEDELTCINAKHALCSQHTVDLEYCNGILNSSFSMITVHALR